MQGCGCSGPAAPSKPPWRKRCLAQVTPVVTSPFISPPPKPSSQVGLPQAGRQAAASAINNTARTLRWQPATTAVLQHSRCDDLLPRLPPATRCYCRCCRLPPLAGDTLFSLGCGRLFEGTPAQMWASLSKLAPLPDDTRVFCAHEYTAGNAKFAAHVDPDNTGVGCVDVHVYMHAGAWHPVCLRSRGAPPACLPACLVLHSRLLPALCCFPQ